MAARPHYAQSWEDPRLLHHLWSAHPADHYHLIASGGDHALELVTKGFQNLQLYDHECHQLAHIQAKINALQRPERERNRLFGYRNGTSGLLHNGRLERFLGLFARRVLPFLVPYATRQAMRNAQGPDAQLAIWDGPWQTRNWSWVAERYFAPKHVDGSARHPGLTAGSERAKHPIDYLRQFREALGQHPLQNNPYVEYPLFGNYAVSSLPYLDLGLSTKARTHLNLHHQSLDDALRTAPTAVRGIHASDILEGRTQAQIDDFFDGVDRSCAPGSTLIFWDHRFRTAPPIHWLDRWRPVTNLPADRVPFYHSVHAYTKL